MSDYKIIEGLPQSVEMEVSNLLKMGWKLNGELFYRNVDGNNIAVQGVVKIVPTVKTPAIFVFEVKCNSKFDPGALINVVYSKPLIDSTFKYLIKIRANSQEEATAEIDAEITYQLTNNRHRGRCIFVRKEHYNG